MWLCYLVPVYCNYVKTYYNVRFLVLYVILTNERVNILLVLYIKVVNGIYRLSDFVYLIVLKVKVFCRAYYFKTIKKQYSDKYECIPQLHEAYDTYIWKAFFGGRNEIFQPIVNENYYYDVNALYPYIMKTYPYISIRSILQNKDVLVGVSKDNDVLPVLPYRIDNQNSNMVDMGIIYPKGVFSNLLFRRIEISAYEGLQDY